MPQETATAPGTAPETAPKTPQQKLSDFLEKIAPILTKFGSEYQKAQGQGGSQTGPVVGRTDLFPQKQPLNLSYDASKATGAFPMPQAAPAREGYSPNPSSAQMMSKLDPSGGAAFNSIQGVSKLLQDWQSRKDKKQQGEASNIAQNLMTALQNNDVTTVHDILNDPKATKVLNKVYKGWLTKSQEAQKPSGPPDPMIQGFETGLKQALSGQGQGQGQQQPQQMPRTMGGYNLPQASPIQQLQAAKVAAETQAAQQDPSRQLASQLTGQEARQSELIANALQVSPKELAILESGDQRAIAKGYYDLLKASATQDALTKRATDLQILKGEQARMLEEMRGKTRIHLGEIIAGAKGDKTKSDDIMFKSLKELIDSSGRLKTNASSMYSKLSSAGKDEEADVFKKQMDEQDANIQRWTEQLDQIKNKKVMNDMFMYLLTPDEKAGEDASGE